MSKVPPLLAQAFMILGAVFCLTPWASSPVALLLGVAIAVCLGNPFTEQTKKISQRLLTYSVVGLGAGMNLLVVGKVGLHGIGYTVLSISLTLLVGFLLGHLLKSDKETSILISVGTAICGGSAIAAIAPVIRAKSHSMSVSLGTVFLLNAVALIVFPFIGHHFALSQSQFGLWSALAIHDTSSVVGAGLQYGAEALQIGTTIKLARALWIVPLTIGFGFYAQKNVGRESSKPKRPWFILGFILMAALVTWVPEAQHFGHMVEMIAKKGLVLTLFLIGSNLTVSTLKSVGIRPLIQGLVLWIFISSTTLYLILADIIR